MFHILAKFIRQLIEMEKAIWLKQLRIERIIATAHEKTIWSLGIIEHPRVINPPLESRRSVSPTPTTQSS